MIKYLSVAVEKRFTQFVGEEAERWPHLGVGLPAVRHHSVHVVRRVVRLAHPQSPRDLHLQEAKKNFGPMVSALA